MAGHVADSRRVPIALCIFQIASAAVGSAAQAIAQPADSGPTLYVRIETTVDSGKAERQILGRPRDSILSALVTQALINYLGTKLDWLENRSVSVLSSADTIRLSLTVTATPIVCTISLDGIPRVSVGCVAGTGGAARDIAHTSLVPIADLGVDITDLREAPGDPRLRHALQTLATGSAGLVQESLFAWVLESTVRLRVYVDSFTALLRPSPRDIGPLLRSAVEGELSQSASVFVVTGDSAWRGANYRVGGSYSFLGNRLRIDVRCVKGVSAERILASRYSLVDTADPKAFSDSIRNLAHDLRYAMEADFRRVLKTVAVIATPGSGGLGLRRPTGREIAISRELMRTATLKLQEFTAVDDSTATPLLRLQVLSDLRSVAQYADGVVAPSEVLADLRTDYLLTFVVQDLGQRLRLTAELNSFDVERPAIGVLVGERLVEVSELGQALDDLLLLFVAEMKRRHYADAPIATFATRALRAPLRSFERLQRLALRVGAPVQRMSPNLFLGRQSGFYAEASYARRVHASNQPGGRYDLSVEVTAGMETTSLVAGMLSLRGPSAFTTTANLRLSLTPWQYSSTSFNVFVGAGVGMQSLRYNFNPGDLDYTGTRPYLESDFSIGPSVFGSMHFAVPFVPAAEMDIALRWFGGIQRITRFTSLPLDRFSRGTGPTGHLGGLYLMWGAAYDF